MSHYYRTSVSIELESVKSGSVKPDGLPSDLAPWSLVNAVAERAAGTDCDDAGTGFGCRDLGWVLYESTYPGKAEDLARAMYGRLVRAAETMGWSGYIAVTSVKDGEYTDLESANVGLEN